MTKLTKLKEFFFKDGKKCSHLYPEKLTIADVLDRDGEFNVIYFCTRCNDYKYQTIGRENLSPDFYLKMERKKYIVHSTKEEVLAYQKQFKGVFGRSAIGPFKHP